MATRGTNGSSGPNQWCRSSADGAIRALAERQGGRIAFRQLRALGLAKASIHWRVRKGRLIRVAPGVYAVGHVRRPPNARLWEGLLRVGEDASISHSSAGALLGFRRSAAPLIDVTCRRKLRRMEGVRLHRSSLPKDEITEHEGIPVTTVTRTLLDLAPRLTLGRLERAANAAVELQLDLSPSLGELLDRYPRRRGTARLRFVLEQLRQGPVKLRSDPEADFLDFVYWAKLRKPLFNYWVDVDGRRYELDAAWPDVRVAVEVDTADYHGGWAAQERDRERDRALVVGGWTVVRVTPAMTAAGRRALRADLEALIYTRAPRRRSSAGRALHS
jgi:very-short-patch-repair endonuclease